MKHLVQLSIAGSLALGSVAAHASIALPTSTQGNLADVVLFADIFNGTTLVAAYAGDTGATVSSVGGGTAPSKSFEDSNLSSFLSQATAGTTVLWAVEGGGINSSGNPFLVTSSPKAGQLTNANNGSVLTSMGTGLYNQLSTINTLIGTGTSLLGTVDAANGGTGFNPQALAADVSNWNNGTLNVAQTGLGSTATLYALTANGQSGTSNSTTTPELTVSLTQTGLVYSALGGGSPPPVPLPAAVWLLGSGLLGLAGVGRRKSKAA
jgi:hypothetical protein